MTNTWHGEFPWQNLKLDTCKGTTLVSSFSSNGYGLYNMEGNLWEWMIDWYQEHSRQSTRLAARRGVREVSGDARDSRVEEGAGEGAVGKVVLYFLCSTRAVQH